MTDRQDRSRFESVSTDPTPEELAQEGPRPPVARQTGLPAPRTDRPRDDTLSDSVRPPTADRVARGFPGMIRAATVAFAAVMLGFLVLYPIFMGFDEQHQLDRVYDVTGGQLIPTTGQELVNEAIPRANAALFEGYPLGLSPTWDAKPSLPRDRRPSLADLGGHAKHPPGGYVNQLSQHPPLYYWLMGGVMAAIPGHDTMPVDQLLFWLRLVNVLILLPLPLLFWRGAAHLIGDGPAARAAAFLPLIIPALPRIGATVNNDNLIILAATATLVGLAAVMMGDLSRGRAWYVAIPLAVALWCKGTSLLLCPVVLICYLVGWARARSKFPLPAALVVAGGAIVGLSWWMVNLIRYGTLQPNGFGDLADQYAGPVRTAQTPFDAAGFWSFVWRNFPTRFWGQLGELEPPYLQPWILWMLTGLVLAGLVLSLIFARGRRTATVLLWLFAVGALAAVIWEGLQYAEQYQGVRGLQGRYALPLVFGLLVVIVVGFGAVLRRHGIWLAPGLLVIGLVATVASFFLWINRMMLPSGTLLSPGSVHRAVANIARFFPFPTPVTVILIVLIIAALAWVMAAVAVLTIRELRAERGRQASGPETRAGQPEGLGQGVTPGA